VALEESFHVGGAYLDRPHDPSGPAKEVVNCRCGVSFEVDVVRPAELVPSRLSETPISGLGRIGQVGGCSLNFFDEATMIRGAPWMIETSGPARNWNEALRMQEYFAERYDSPGYSRWAEQALEWHAHGGPEVRNAVDVALRGGRSADGETWLNALAEAPLTRREVYRGLGWPRGEMSLLRVRRMFPPGRGSRVDIPLGGFTEDRDLALRLARELAGDDGVTLLITLSPRARAIPIGNWAGSEDLFDRHEVLSGGLFSVIFGPVVLEERAIQVVLDQVGVYRP